jgi:hypothetical protein
VLRAAQARLFFFDFADLAVDMVPRGFGQGIEEFLERLGLAEFAGENGVDGHGDWLWKIVSCLNGNSDVC